MYDSSPLGRETGYGLDSQKPHRRPFYKTIWFWLLALIVVAAAVVIPVYFLAIKPNHKDSSKAASGSASNSTASGKPQAAIRIGGDGSVVTKDDGTTFTYNNSFGGYCEFPASPPAPRATPPWRVSDTPSSPVCPRRDADRALHYE